MGCQSHTRRCCYSENPSRTSSANIKSQLSGDVVANLQGQIDEKVDIADKATQADVLTPTSDTKWMTPLATKQLVEGGVWIDGERKGVSWQYFGDKEYPMNSLANAVSAGAAVGFANSELLLADDAIYLTVVDDKLYNDSSANSYPISIIRFTKYKNSLNGTILLQAMLPAKGTSVSASNRYYPITQALQTKTKKPLISFMVAYNASSTGSGQNVPYYVLYDSEYDITYSLINAGRYYYNIIASDEYIVRLLQYSSARAYHLEYSRRGSYALMNNWQPVNGLHNSSDLANMSYIVLIEDKLLLLDNRSSTVYGQVYHLVDLSTGTVHYNVMTCPVGYMFSTIGFIDDTVYFILHSNPGPYKLLSKVVCFNVRTLSYTQNSQSYLSIDNVSIDGLGYDETYIYALINNCIMKINRTKLSFLLTPFKFYAKAFAISSNYYRIISGLPYLKKRIVFSQNKYVDLDNDAIYEPRFISDSGEARTFRLPDSCRLYIHSLYPEAKSFASYTSTSIVFYGRQTYMVTLKEGE